MSFEERQELLKAKFSAAYGKLAENHPSSFEMSREELVSVLYFHMFNAVPNKICMWHYPTYMKERVTDTKFGDKCVDHSEKENDKWDDIITENTLLKIIDYYKNNRIPYVLWRWDDPVLIAETGDVLTTYGNLLVFTKSDELPKYIMDNIVFCETGSSRYYYLAYGKNRYETIDLDIMDTDVDIGMNYNDDLPYDEIVETLESDEAGLIIFRGKPGTAKSTLIRHLISKIDADFVYLDHSCFNSMTDSSFINTLSEYENSVLILEDCEDMVRDRMSDGSNNKIAALLNLSSGLLADSFKFKIICTFNAPITKVDKALLRKGRLKVDYEFMPLTPAKTAALASKLGKEIEPGASMIAGDIYNSDKTVEFGKREDRKIGFV
jgi:hypothetical protein